MAKKTHPVKRIAVKKTAKKKSAAVLSRTQTGKKTTLRNNEINISLTDETNVTKKYPIIYSYIYEREQEDMNRILKEHKSASTLKEDKTKIIGFTVKNNELVPVIPKKKK